MGGWFTCGYGTEHGHEDAKGGVAEGRGRGGEEGGRGGWVGGERAGLEDEEDTD